MQWKQHPTYTRFDVSDKGQVRNHLTGHIYKQRKFEGYMSIGTHIEGKSLTFFVHRLVAQTYQENPNNLPQVNHCDGIKTHNTSGNLEWVTEKDNIKHAIENGLRHRVLSKEQISYVRQVYTPRHRKYGRNALAALFKVSPDTIAYYVHHKNIVE